MGFLLIIKTEKDPRNYNIFDKFTLSPDLGHMFISIK